MSKYFNLRNVSIAISAIILIGVISDLWQATVTAWTVLGGFLLGIDCERFLAWLHSRRSAE